MIFYIYKITNLINGKIYVGAHKTKNIDDGYIGSGKYLKRAINKYGIDNFEKEILQVFDNSEDMYQIEYQLVNEEFIKRNDTYNIKEGGKGRFDHLNYGICKDKNKRFDNKWQKKISPMNERENWSEELKIKMRNGWIKGGKKSKGCIVVKDEFGNKKRVSVDDEDYKNGILIPICKGRKQTEEAKIKIGKANSIKQKGNKNSQYGTCWIYNIKLEKNKKIVKDDLQNFIDKGWRKGRKIPFLKK